MNDALNRIADAVGLDAPFNERLRFEFGYACALRVRHLLEEAAVAECLEALGQYLAGSLERSDLDGFAAMATRLANGHEGSKSIDGCGHAAVSASYAVANALCGKAMPAAEYAAYAVVYSEGGYAAVAHRESFMPEYEWQATCLEGLTEGRSRHESACIS